MIRVLIPADSGVPHSILTETFTSLAESAEEVRDKVSFELLLSMRSFGEIINLIDPLKVSEVNINYHEGKMPNRKVQLMKLGEIKDDDYIGFHDADDTVSPHFFKELYEKGLHNPDFIICNCQRRMRDTGEIHLKNYMQYLLFSYMPYIKGQIANTPWGIYVRGSKLKEMFGDFSQIPDELYGGEFYIQTKIQRTAISNGNYKVSPLSIYYWNTTTSSLSSGLSIDDMVEGIYQSYIAADKVSAMIPFRSFMKILYWRSKNQEELMHNWVCLRSGVEPFMGIITIYDVNVGDDPLDLKIQEFLETGVIKHSRKVKDTTLEVIPSSEEYERRIMGKLNRFNI